MRTRFRHVAPLGAHVCSIIRIRIWPCFSYTRVEIIAAAGTTETISDFKLFPDSCNEFASMAHVDRVGPLWPMGPRGSMGFKGAKWDSMFPNGPAPVVIMEPTGLPEGPWPQCISMSPMSQMDPMRPMCPMGLVGPTSLETEA